ncbi:hypothetical protein HK096_008669 [Nowakowskiella sp. JEL0078]|nr:hypothetical protein HK096_008669 [Nowakowskiella sp. JEL0078]
MTSHFSPHSESREGSGVNELFSISPLSSPSANLEILPFDLPNLNSEQNLKSSLKLTTAYSSILSFEIITKIIPMLNSRERFIIATFFRLHKDQMVEICSTSEYVLNWASKKGIIWLLDLILSANRDGTDVDSVRDQRYSETAMDEASANGFVSVLDWWENSGLELFYTSKAIDLASSNGHVNVLNWWKKQGFHLFRAMQGSNVKKHIKAIEWDKKSRFYIEYTGEAVNQASGHNHIPVLDWWKNSGLHLLYDKYALFKASENADIDVLNWWHQSGLILVYDEDILWNASKSGNIVVLDWWKKSGLELKYDERAIDQASHYGQLEVLDWWKKSGLYLKYSSNSMELMGFYDNVNSLEWWKNSGLPLKFNTRLAMNYSSDSGCVKVLEWWKLSGFPLDFDSNEAMKLSMKTGMVDVALWWNGDSLLAADELDEINQKAKVGRTKVLNWWNESGNLLKYSRRSLDTFGFKRLQTMISLTKEEGMGSLLMYISTALKSSVRK